MQEKSEVVRAHEVFLDYAKNLGRKIKDILSDNGLKFKNEEVRKLLKKNGVIQRIISPYTPEQIGLSERQNRTIVEMTETLNK